MSTANMLPVPVNSLQFGGQPPAPQPSPVRRRTTPQQGRALEVLGHAIEYLVDSRLFDQWQTPADASAVHLLMERSRAVFADCAEIVPWHQRVQQSLVKKLHLDAASQR